MIHDFGENQPGPAAGGSQWLAGYGQGADGLPGAIAQVTELRDCRLRRVVAGNGEAQVNRGRQPEESRPELGPGLPVKTGVTVEARSAYALQTKPRIRIVCRKRSGGHRRDSSIGAVLEEGAGDTGRAETPSIPAVRSQVFAQHQTSLRQHICEIQALH